MQNTRTKPPLLHCSFARSLELWLLSVFKLLILAASSVSVSAAQPADLVVQHANVITIDTNAPRADAFAVTDGKFVAVSSDAEVKKWIGANTKVLDLKSKTVVPGFIDAHLHPQAVYPKDSP